MLRMTSLALAIIASLFAEALAAEETFDTNFMFGGMKGPSVIFRILILY